MHAADYGSGFKRTEGGEIIASGGPGNFVIDDRPDPDKPDRGRTPPTVRGTRRYDAARILFGDKSAEFSAVERYRDDCSVASGARPDQTGEFVDVAFDPSRCGPSDRVMDALRRVGDAWFAMGAETAGVVIWAVLGDGKLLPYDKNRHVRHGTGAKLLRLGIRRLLAHYDEIDSTTRGPAS